MTAPTVVVTGAAGFIGRHCVDALERLGELHVVPIPHGDGLDALLAAVDRADVVVHLAGVNRPPDPSAFHEVNAGLTRAICERCVGRDVLVVLASSSQAGNGTPYGDSKLAAEEIVREHARCGGRGVAMRFPNVFGKWARPRYNSVVATFAHAVANGEPYEIRDVAAEVTLLHVGDAVNAILDVIASPPAPGDFVLRTDFPARRVTLGALAELLESFRAQRTTLVLPDFADPFVRQLYSTYLSYLPASAFSYDLLERTDNRGALAEFVKSPWAGQLFVSRTKPGITRGNHWHDVKVEKFLVVSGEARIRFRHVHGGDIIEYAVSGDRFQVVDIPPGYAHSIENVGTTDLVTLFWANEIFDPAAPDTHARKVSSGD